jgi:hypothetical protein
VTRSFGGARRSAVQTTTTTKEAAVRGGWLGLSHAWKEGRGVMLPGAGHGEWATWGEG